LEQVGVKKKSGPKMETGEVSRRKEFIKGGKRKNERNHVYRRIRGVRRA